MRVLLSDTIRGLRPSRSPGVRTNRIARGYVAGVVRRGALSDFVDDLQVQGRLTFTREEAMAALGVGADAMKLAAWRLAKRGRLVSPRRGFYVVIPLEYRKNGAPPLDRWLPDLLRFHGARELGRELVDGVVVVAVDRRLPPITVGELRVGFQVASRRPTGGDR